MKLKIILTITMLSLLFGCKTKSPLSTVDDVDLKKYMGKWYEIARFDHSFERNLKCVSATYSLQENGKVKVLNEGFNSKKEKWESANGIAKVPNSSKPGEIKVSFFRPFYGDYFVIKLDEEYKHVLVGSPTRDYLWVLSRSQSMDKETYNQYLIYAKENGFDVSKLELIPQDCVK